MANTTVSYGTAIIGKNKMFDPTLKIYREVLKYCLEIFNDEYSFLNAYSNKERFNLAEKLIHTTKDNTAKYKEFDELFYKFPSYLRRDAIQKALGKLDSFNSNLENNKNHKLSLSHFEFPTFFKKEQFKKEIQNGNVIYRIKVYKANKNNFYKGDWVWEDVTLRRQDLKYLNNNIYNDLGLVKEYSPILFKKHKKYYLRFAFDIKTNLSKEVSSQKAIKKQKITAVDLGINTSAVCSAVNGDGTIYDKLFSNQSKEKDQMHHLLNRLKKKQQYNIQGKFNALWTKINNLNKSIAEKTANDIINFAIKNNSDVIVLEHLSQMKIKGSKKQKLHLWKKRYILKIVTSKAHRAGIRVNTINPRNTSYLAFDGSGPVLRNKKNYSLCIFSSGKQYNSDLNASYNIAARYFIGKYKKTISEKKWSLLEAKVPLIGRRSQSTLSTLISLNAAIETI